MNTFGFSKSLIGGLELIPEPHLAEWKRRPKLPKSKRKRIRMKWRKKYPQGAIVPQEVMYQMGNKILAHPDIIARIKKQLEERQRP